MGELPLYDSDKRMVGPRWTDTESLHTRSQSVRLVVRDRSRDRVEFCGDRDRYRDRRIDRVSFVDLRDRRDKTDRWFDLAERRDSDLGFAGYGGSDDPDRR